MNKNLEKIIKVKYASAIYNITSDTFTRQDVLYSIQKMNPDYHIGSFNRHFSKLLSLGCIENIAENLYIKVTPDSLRKNYKNRASSAELIAIESFLESRFPLAEFLLFEIIMLNEFLNHQIAQNTIIVTVEKMLIDAFFEELSLEFPSVMIAPRIEELSRYGNNGTIIIDKLQARYPKNSAQKHRYSIEKLLVDLFAEKLLKALLNPGDYPALFEIAFKKYIINETRLFNYAKSRRVDTEIKVMIKKETNIKLFTR